MKSRLFQFIVTTFFCASIAASPHVTVNIGHGHNHQHPTQQPNYAPHFAHTVPTFVKSGGVIATVAILGSFMRLYNKQYNDERLEFLDTINPLIMLVHPLRCIDDGFIGHMGSGGKPSYGILGTGMAWVQPIDNTIVAIDNTKRKIDAWFAWINRNIHEIKQSASAFASLKEHVSTQAQQTYEKLTSYINNAHAA